MEIPWTLIFIMTLYECMYGAWRLKNDKSPDFAFGIVFGIWALCAASYLFAHVAWK